VSERLGIKPGASKKGRKVSAATKKEQKKIQKELREELAVAVEIQYLAPLSSCYSFTVAQVNVKGSTRNVSLVTFRFRFN
jgi:hypothetical protein